MKTPKNLKRSLSVLLIVQLFFSFILAQLALADTTTTTLNQTINAGTLAIDIVDSGGTTVGSPSVAFGAVTFSFDAQDATATLGETEQKIRLSNPTASDEWNVAIAATGGPGTEWTDGTYTYPFDSTGGADTGRLTVDPSVGTITPIGAGCTNTSVSTGTSDFFVNITTDSIDLMTASLGADIGCRWDLTGVSLSQRIPAGQQASSYTLGMTISAL